VGQVVKEVKSLLCIVANAVIAISHIGGHFISKIS